MIPIRISLKNFLSYRGDVSIDFRGLGLACLSGENGAGKSALLDAMTWAIWAKSRAKSNQDLITLGESDVEVTLVFQMGNREYRIMRRVTASRHTLEFDSRSPGAANWLPISGDSIRDTQDRIEDELRLDYETFANSAFLRQGESGLFTQNRPGERKRILSEILNLSSYDALAEAARSEHRLRRDAISAAQARMGTLDLKLADRHQIEVEQAELDEKVEQAATRRDELQITVNAIRDRITAAELSEAALERLQGRVQRLREQLALVQDDELKLKSSLAELENEVSNAPKLAAELETLRVWRSKADALSQALASQQPIRSRINELEQLVSAAKSDLERQRALASQAATTLRERLDHMDLQLAEIEQLRSKHEKYQPELRQLPTYEQALEQAQHTIAKLSAHNATLKTQMAEIKRRIDSLAAGEATCPVCRRPLAEGDHEHIRDEWTGEGTQLGDAFRTNQAVVAEREKEAGELQRQIALLRELSIEAARNEAKLTQLIASTEAQPTMKEQLTENEAETRRLEKVLASESFALEARKELTHQYELLSDHPYDKNQHNEARERSQGLENAEKRFQAIQQADTKITHIKEQLRAQVARKLEIDRELEEAHQESTEVEKSIEDIAETRRNHTKYTTELTTLADSLARMEQQRGTILRQLEELGELAEELRQLQKQSKSLSNEHDAYAELTTAFGRNGIQAMVIENVLPELQDGANRILSRMSTKHLAVEFRTTRAAVASDKTIDTLDIVIRDESGQRDYQLFSGGEAFRIDFAIRVALSKLLARRAGASVDTLIIDEGFGSQDQHGRDGLIDALQSVSNEFELILVITHVDELRYQFPNRIEIVKTDAGSRATLV